MELAYAHLTLMFCSIFPSNHMAQALRSWRRPVLFLAIAVILCTLSGCGVSLDSPAPGRDEVLAYVAECCPNEGFEIVSTEEVCELPQQVVYTLRSTERDLTFTAVSEIVEPGPSYIPWPSFPYENISCDYATVVSKLYRSPVTALIADEVERTRPGSLAVSDLGHLCFETYDDLEALMAICEKADALYHPEFTYNDPAWCREHISASFTVIRVLSVDEAGEPDDWEALGPRVVLNGSFDARETLDGLVQSYAQLISDGTLPTDTTLPERYLAGRHRTVLSRMTIDGAEVPFGFGSSSYADGNPYQREGISSGDNEVARWDDERGCYRVYLHIGRLTSTDAGGADRTFDSASWLMEHLASMAGGTYASDALGCRWSCNGVEGSLEAATNAPWEDDVATLVFAVDGHKERVGLANDSGVYTGTVFSYVDADVFARLINCTYTVDEETGTIAFTAKGSASPARPR